MKKIIAILITVSMLISCSYSVYMSAYPHLRTIDVKIFDNKSDTYEIESELNDSLVRQFLIDSRLKIASVEVDCILTGVIKAYENKIVSFNVEEAVDEYEVSIAYDIDFFDNVNSQTLWKAENAIIRKKYYPNSTDDLKIKTEEEARQEIFEDIFKKIMENTLEKW
ncbi:MAG: LPS assembly lipoprotein LptE [Candidatus Cloacimonetes bacterium]|nr:LPS assembly lipoprotein LptE [Candidatus Cloacimonadota bacterium]